MADAKICRKCDESHPATTEFFPPCNGRLRPYCRPCWRAYERAYFWANREAKRESKKRQWAKTDKSAARARVEKWKTENPDKARAIELRRLEKIKNTPEMRAKARARVKRHRERLGREEYNRRQRLKRAANPERGREHTRRWRERNLDKVRAAEREYRQNNREKVIADAETRRARMLNAEGSFTGHDVIALVRQFGRVCHYCGVTKLKRFQVDHFIPLSRAGTNWPDNLVISCRSCNLAKGAKLPWEWMPERFSEGQTPR